MTFEGPGVFFARPLLLRADSAGRLRWSRGSRGDRPGAWSVNAEGDLGSRRTLRYLLSELDLPLTSVVQGETLFNVYHIPESKLHFDPGVRNATVAMISQFYRDARRMILEDIGFAFEEPIDFFLLPEASSLQREVVAGGASGGSGFEAGVSLLNFARSGVYIDMSIPDLYGYAHIVAHELVHQITGRIEGSRRAPLWFIEGFADYYGHDVGLELVGDQELPWRRLTRAVARRAVEQDRWIDLATVSAYEVWLEETSLDRLERMYAESYVTADYVARTYGEAAIRPLLEALADRPDELDGVFLQLFNVSFSELQAGVREDVLRLDAYELELRAVAEYASAVFDILDGAEELSLQWNLYIVARPSLSVPERIARLQALQNSYRAFDADVAGMTPPDAAAGVHEVFVRLFPAFIEASEAFLELERGGGQDAIDRGNAALDDGNLFLQASRDLLVKLLADSRIAISEVFGG